MNLDHPPIRLYLMFDNKSDKATIQELISKRKVKKIIAYELYKMILEESRFKEVLKTIKTGVYKVIKSIL